MSINLYNVDCMEFMKDKPDNYYDLAIVDPPFRENNEPTQDMRGFKTEMKSWHKPAKIEFFESLARASKYQIVMGGNYFTKFLDPNNSWIVWYKNNDGVHFSMCELFWTSFKKNVKLFEYRPMGNNDNKFHPTQKPVALYKWLLKIYAKPDYKILDTHGGSMSIAIACYDFGCSLDLCEIDKDYFEAGQKRFNNHINQLRLEL